MDTIKGHCHLAPLTTPVGEQRFYPQGKHTMALPNMHSDWSPVLPLACVFIHSFTSVNHLQDAPSATALWRTNDVSPLGHSVLFT